MFFTLRSSGDADARVASSRMDRQRSRMPGRTFVGFIVLAAAFSCSLVIGGQHDAGASSDARGSGSRHAAVHEHAAVLRAILPARNGDRVAKSSHRETFALAVASLTVALAYAASRRLRGPAATLLPSYVLFGAPRAPPSLQLQP